MMALFVVIGMAGGIALLLAILVALSVTHPLDRTLHPRVRRTL